MERVPDWMAGIDVQFACNNCPNRQLKNIAFVSLETAAPATAKIDLEPDEAADSSDIDADADADAEADAEPEAAETA
jgi:hypothetical protein